MADNPVQKLLAKMRNAPQNRDLPAAQDPYAGMPPATRRTAPAPGMRRPQPQQMQMKNAAVVYGFGSLLLYGLSFYNLANAEWFNGFMLMLPSTCLAYLAYRYMTQAE